MSDTTEFETVIVPLTKRNGILDPHIMIGTWPVGGVTLTMRLDYLPFPACEVLRPEQARAVAEALARAADDAEAQKKAADNTTCCHRHR
jgi:hypothetical protein